MLTRKAHIRFGGGEESRGRGSGLHENKACKGINCNRTSSRKCPRWEVVYMKIRHAKASIVIEQVLESVPVFQDKNSKAFVKCRFFWLPWRRSRRSFNYDGTLAAST